MIRFCVCSHFWGGTALALIAAAPALADDLTVTGNTTTPVTTKAAQNNTPGNITVNSGASVTVTTGTAATINSNNTITNNGVISSSGSTNSNALLIDGTTPLTGISLVNTGTISVTGTATGAAGNIGLLIAGGPVAGTITSGLLTGSISVTGDNAFGVSILSPFTGNIALKTVSVTGTNSTAILVGAQLTGNLALSGTTSSTGAGGYGLNVTAPISGTVTNGGSITAGTTQTVDSNGNIVVGLVPVAAVHLGASVGGGFINDRYYIDPTTGAPVPTPADLTTTTDTLVTGTISSVGGAPAIAITPAAVNPQAITIGAAGSGADAYAIVNRGTIQVSLGGAGQVANGVLIGGGGAAAPTTLVGGINSQPLSSFAISSVDATATGIHLLTGAVVPTFINGGTFSVASSATAAVGSTPAGPGGDAFGVVIDPGASLTSIVNTGTITIQGVGTTHNGYGIVDRSGTLASIVNTGTITARAGMIQRAIDLTGSNGAVAVTNSGTITGDIAFGTGSSTLNLQTGSAITGAIAFGSGPSFLNLSGTASLTNGLTASPASPLNVTLADSALLNLTGGPTTLNKVSASGNSVLVVPVTPGAGPLIVNTTASFTGQSVVRLSLQSLNAQQNLSIIQANQGFSTDHLSTLVDASIAPYLFTATSPTATATTLSISLTRKSAADIGLTGGQAALFNASIPALANSPAESSAIANLPSQAAVVAAYRQITPPSFGRGVLRSAEALSDGGFGAAAARLSVVNELHQGGAAPVWGVWVQEFGDFNQGGAGANEAGFRASSFGLAGGIDVPVLGLTAGVGAVTNYSTIHQVTSQGFSPSEPVKVSTQGIIPYVGKSWKALFVQVSGLAAINTYNSDRQLDIGTLSDTVLAHGTGQQYAANATVGARLHFGNFRIIPTNAIAWTQLHQGGYSEVGGGAFNLGVGSSTNSVTTDTAKVSLAYLIKLIDSNLELEVHAGYVHQFDNKATNTDVHFLTLPGDPFTMTGDAVKTEQLSYGGGVGYVQDDFKVKFGYDRRQETGFHDQQMALSAGFTF